MLDRIDYTALMPEEIIWEVLKFIDFPTLLQAKQVNKRWNTLLTKQKPDSIFTELGKLKLTNLEKTLKMKLVELGKAMIMLYSFESATSIKLFEEMVTDILTFKTVTEEDIKELKITERFMVLHPELTIFIDNWKQLLKDKISKLADKTPALASLCQMIEFTILNVKTIHLVDGFQQNEFNDLTYLQKIFQTQHRSKVLTTILFIQFLEAVYLGPKIEQSLTLPNNTYHDLELVQQANKKFEKIDLATDKPNLNKTLMCIALGSFLLGLSFIGCGLLLLLLKDLQNNENKNIDTSLYFFVTSIVFLGVGSYAAFKSKVTYDIKNLLRKAPSFQFFKVNKPNVEIEELDNESQMAIKV